MRASVLVLGPLLARLGKARVSLPGGCAIGARPINLHLKGLASLGASIELKHGYVEASADRLKGADIYFDIVTVTGTENIMMAAVTGERHNRAAQCRLRTGNCGPGGYFDQNGGQYSGAGTSSHYHQRGCCAQTGLQPPSFRIESRPEPLWWPPFYPGKCHPCKLRTGTSRGADKQVAACGRRNRHCRQNHNVKGRQNIASVDVKTQPYPGFPTDMQAQFMVLMSIADGTSTISETIFENRFIHVSELKRMGADVQVSGNTAIVRGVSHLSGAPVMATDLRASASRILAGLVADGKNRSQPCLSSGSRISFDRK